MKTLLSVLIGITLITMGGCSTSSPTSPVSAETGSVAFRLDKAAVPQGVVTVAAVLTRSGYDSLAASVDVQTDTSATLQMSGIPVGDWHLTVNALDGGGNILYTGEADVNITAGATMQLDLTLQPVSQGTGSISITVNWGTTGVHFVDYAGNPVLTSSNNPSSPVNVIEGKVIYENGAYKMWYVSVYNPGYDIWYAKSNDGINWTTQGTQPVLTTDDTSMWDYGYSIAGGAVMQDGSIYRMYYNAIVSSGGPSYTGLATSSDGIHWENYPSPIISPDGSTQTHIGTMTVLKVNGEYFLYYHSSPADNYDGFVINVATSSDGVHFTEYSGNPILTATSSWEGAGITYPSAIYDNGQFVMIYENSSRTEYGIAYSSDGIHWIKSSNNPVMSVEKTSGNLIKIDYPDLVKAADGYRIYYTGVDQNYNMRIRFMSSSTIR